MNKWLNIYNGRVTENQIVTAVMDLVTMQKKRSGIVTIRLETLGTQENE